MSMTTAQTRALGKLTDEWECAYKIGESLPTLDALVKAGCAKKRNPGGPGAMFSPRTFWLYRLAKADKPAKGD